MFNFQSSITNMLTVAEQTF